MLTIELYNVPLLLCLLGILAISILITQVLPLAVKKVIRKWRA